MKFPTPPYGIPVFLFFFFCVSIHSFSQELLEVKGRVVEVTDGVPKGIAEVQVSVSGESWDITDESGRFRLHLPSTREYVTLILENCPYPMISPRNGYLPLPPPESLVVRVCGRENERLRQKVDSLNRSLDEVESRLRLSKRRMAEMHEKMMVRILSLEEQVEALENELLEKGEDLDAARFQIAELEKRNRDLERQLFDALRQQYLRQQQYQREISAAAENYLVRLKDLRDWLGHFDHYFYGHGAQEDFNKKNRAYETAWEHINLHHQNYLVNLNEYWDNPLLTAQAEELFEFILRDIHEAVIVGEYNPRVIEPLQELVGQPYSNRLRKSAKKGAAATKGVMDGLIPELEARIRRFEQQMMDG